MVPKRLSHTTNEYTDNIGNAQFQEGEKGKNTPEDWTYFQFKQFLDIRSGKGFKFSEYASEGIRLLRIDNVSWGNITWDSIAYLPLSYADEYPELLLKEGDILLALNRPITQGKLKLAILNREDAPAILYQRVGKVLFKNKRIDKFFTYYLLQNFLPEFVINSSVGSDQPFINITALRELKLPLPSLVEQKKIAAILSSVDEAIASTQAVIDQTRKVKQGLLQQLLTRGIGHTRFKESAIGEIPESWEVVELGDITRESAFGPRFSGDLYDVDGNYGSVRTTDINENWEINYETVPRAMLPEVQCENHRLIDGDLLVTRSGSCGIVCVFREQAISMIPGAFLIRFRLKNYVNPEFVRLAMMTPTAQSSMATMAAGGVQKNLSGTNLKKLLLPLPSLEEQDKIVSCYNHVLQSEKSSQANLQQLEQLKRGLMQDLLTGKVRVGCTS